MIKTKGYVTVFIAGKQTDGSEQFCYGNPVPEEPQKIFKDWLFSKDPSTLNRASLPYIPVGCIPNILIDVSDNFLMTKLYQFCIVLRQYKTGVEFENTYKDLKAQKKAKNDGLIARGKKPGSEEPGNQPAFIEGSNFITQDLDALKQGTYEEVIRRLKEKGIAFSITPSKSHMRLKEKKFTELPEIYREGKSPFPPEIIESVDDTGTTVFHEKCTKCHLTFPNEENFLCIDFLGGNGGIYLGDIQTQTNKFLEDLFKDLIIPGYEKTCVDKTFTGNQGIAQRFNPVPYGRVKAEYYPGEKSIYDYVKNIDISGFSRKSVVKSCALRVKTDDKPKTEASTVKVNTKVTPKMNFKGCTVSDLASAGIPYDPFIEYYIHKGFEIYDYDPVKMAYTLECPNFPQHSSGDPDSLEYYLVGAPGRASGGANCFHAHCNEEGKSGRDVMFESYIRRFPEDAERIKAIRDEIRSKFNVFEFPEEFAPDTKTFTQAGYEIPRPRINKHGEPVDFFHNVTADKSLLKAMIKLKMLDIYRSKRTLDSVQTLDSTPTSPHFIISRVMSLLEGFGALYRTTQKNIEYALDEVICERTKDPVFEFFNSKLEGKTWDGIPRIDEFLKNYCHFEYYGIFTKEYAVAFSRYLFSSLIAVIEFCHRSKGCIEEDSNKPQVSIIPALVSSETAGIGKTRLFEVLTFDNKSLLARIPKNVIEGATDDRDLITLAGNSMIATCDDYTPFPVSLQTTIKNLTSSNYGEFREMYSRNKVTVPRGFIYVLTTNERHFLKDDDPGVNRRFACLEMKNSFSSDEDMNRIRTDLIQIYLEAVEIYHKNGNQPEFKPLEDILKTGEIARYFSYRDDINDAIEIGCRSAIQEHEKVSKEPLLYHNAGQMIKFNGQPIAPYFTVAERVKSAIETVTGNTPKNLPRAKIINKMKEFGYKDIRTKTGHIMFTKNQTEIRLIEESENK